ncbi:MAG: hypothetical protein HF982_09830 [Desulfobacteraceae bacterium]|nr:hypothetical protein [Desulfobacteraceae bacterium]MBC2719865.1 hypothetical protein [Desulfobacteraceae bacterium]
MTNHEHKPGCQTCFLKGFCPKGHEPAQKGVSQKKRAGFIPAVCYQCIDALPGPLRAGRLHPALGKRPGHCWRMVEVLEQQAMDSRSIGLGLVVYGCHTKHAQALTEDGYAVFGCAYYCNDGIAHMFSIAKKL